MTAAEERSSKLDEVARLATLIAERIFDAQNTGRQIPPEQFTALVAAARLLQEQDVPWPSLVEDVLYEAGKRFSEANGATGAPEPEPESDGSLAGLSRFFNGFRRG